MKKSTTTIETCRTELTLTLWNKGDRETYKQTVYVFTSKVPITIETAEKLIKQKHYLLPLSFTPEEDYERLNDSIVLDIALGAHIMLSREYTAYEWRYSGVDVKPATYSLSRNMHDYSVDVVEYDRETKSIKNSVYYVSSFRSISVDTIKKQVESEIPDSRVLLEIDTDHIREYETTIYISELQAYSIWC